LAADGQVGLAQAAALKPNVIILDLGMPKMDGWEVARQLKANGATRAIPIIALTGHVTSEARQRALDAGVNEFCTKPCLPSDLVATIRRH
jgi:two-component system, cell cycle response regulator DivK